MKREKEKRKVRSDKKRDVKPTISVNLKECVNRLSYITNTPVKEVAESICEAGLKSKKVIEYLSQYFRRDFRLGNTFYIGDLNRISLQKKKFNVPADRITIRFTQSTYEKINALAYALDVTPSRTTGILLDASIRNTNFINTFAKNYIKVQLDPARMKELKKVLKFINENNPYEEEITWVTLLSYIFEEIKEGTSTIKTALVNWIDKYK